MGYNPFRTRRAARMVSSLVCQTSNSEKPGRPMGTPSRRKVIRLSSTCLPDMWKACAPVSAARAGRLAGVTPAPTRISRSGPAASTSRRSREAPAGALAACPLVRMVPSSALWPLPAPQRGLCRHQRHDAGCRRPDGQRPLPRPGRLRRWDAVRPRPVLLRVSTPVTMPSAPPAPARRRLGHLASS